jgi:hypothetical protein
MKCTEHTQKNGAVSNVNKNLFLTPHKHNIHCQQRELSKFLKCYQQFASHAHCGAAGPVSKMASQQEKAFCVLHFQVSRYVITAQREFCARFKKYVVLVWCIFFEACTKLTHTVITDLDTSQRSTQKAFFCCDAILETSPMACSKHEKLGQFPLLSVYVVPV